jgi:acyl-CoA synthetase (AMP-forming)/AMP-acid ligase II
MRRWHDVTQLHFVRHAVIGTADWIGASALPGRDNIAYRKVPHSVTFVDELPKTATGKIQKFIMREQAIQELGLQLAANTQTA